MNKHDMTLTLFPFSFTLLGRNKEERWWMESQFMMCQRINKTAEPVCGDMLAFPRFARATDSVFPDNVSEAFNSKLLLFSSVWSSSSNISSHQPFRSNPSRKENNLNFYFYTSLWCLKRFYNGLTGLHKTFWCTAKKSENKDLNICFSIQLSETHGTGRVNSKYVSRYFPALDSQGTVRRAFWDFLNIFVFLSFSNDYKLSKGNRAART